MESSRAVFEWRQLQLPSRIMSVQKWPSPNSSTRQKWETCVENPKSQRQKPKWEKWHDCRVKITSKELEPLHSVKKGILQNACSTSPKMDASWGKSALMRWPNWWTTYQSVVAMLKISRQLGCVISGYGAAEVSILLKSSNIRKRIRCVRFTKSVVRHGNIRDQNPSLKMTCPSELISVTPILQNLRIGLRKRRNGKSKCAREAARRLAKNILKWKEKIEQHSLAFGK